MDGHGKKMNEESREHLSSLMDGEITREASRFLVRRLGSDDELRMTWARYHLVRDCLRYRDGSLASSDLNSKIQQALAQDSAQAMPRRFATGWLKPVAGVAIAASVALMAIVTVGPGQSPVSGPAGELAESPQLESFVSPNNGFAPRPYSQQVSASGGMGSNNQKLNSYLLRHYQVAGSTGGKGFVTFVPIVVTRAVPQQESESGAEDEKEVQKNGSESAQK